jgi:hypothetical protein
MEARTAVAFTTLCVSPAIQMSLFIRASIRGGYLDPKRIERAGRHLNLFLSGDGQVQQFHLLSLDIEVAKSRARRNRYLPPAGLRQ